MSDSTEQQQAQNSNLLPRPHHLEMTRPHLKFHGPPKVLFPEVNTQRLQAAAIFCLGRLTQWVSASDAQKSPSVRSRQTRQATLTLRCTRESSGWPTIAEDESYQLGVEAEEITLCAPTERGVCHGLETLVQLAHPGKDGEWSAPQVFIRDAPAYPWRGLCLDVCRHWFAPDVIRRVLDGMAAEHLNVLHLHLNDDQAFRLKLASLGKLQQTQCFTRHDIDQLVIDANRLGIRIVPEIDLPGHATALLAGYPELAAGTPPHQPSADFGGHDACLDPSQERTYELLQSVFTELADWFPDCYVHIGGDEVATSIWQKNPAISAFMEQMELTGPGDLQAYFNRRVLAILKDLKKTMVVWDEALHPSLPPEVVIQCWRGVATREMALAGQHKVLFSSGYYLDLNYAAKTHYGFDPGASNASLQQAEDAAMNAPGMAEIRATALQFMARAGFPSSTPDIKVEPSQILGGEACLWSELVDEQCLDTRLFSRLPAIAERLWLGEKAADASQADLYSRLPVHWQYLERTTSLRPLGQVSKRLAEFGLAPEATQALTTLVAYLEPVKWYLRLLGEAQITARATGTKTNIPRPYTTTTLLNRIVDICPPESLAGHQFEHLAAQFMQNPKSTETQNALAAVATLWQQQADALAGIEIPGIQEILPLSERLGFCGALLQNMLNTDIKSQTLNPDTQARLAEMSAAVGELRLVVVPSLKLLLTNQPSQPSFP